VSTYIGLLCSDKELKKLDAFFFCIFVFFSNIFVVLMDQAMLPAFEAILGQRSAHSLDTGPVMADPFISP
jgi:hypothetical protein